MAITPDQQALLEAPFKFEEHGFTDASPPQPFLIKSAIRSRLNRVDPLWSTGEPKLVFADESVVVVSLLLTIHGATRCGVGTCPITRADKNGNKYEGYALAKNAAKAFKHAATDALARAAFDFNVGAYLKNKPKGVTQTTFPDWLAKLPAPHWAANGGRERIAAWLEGASLTWTTIKDLIEPGRVLERLPDTTLTEAQFKARLHQVKADLLKPSTSKADAQPEAVQSHQPSVEPNPQRLGAETAL